MNIIVLGEIHYFNISEEIPITILDKISIHFGKKFVADKYSDIKIVEEIGKMNYKLLRILPIHMGNYRINNGVRYSPSSVISSHQGIIHSFQISSWLVKDNSINIGSIYAISQNNESVDRIQTKNLYSTSLGEINEVVFNKEELEEIMKWNDKIIPYLTLTEEIIKKYDLKNVADRKIYHINI